MKIELKAFRGGGLFSDGIGSFKMVAESAQESRFLRIIEHCANGNGHQQRAVLLYALSHGLTTERERDWIKTIIERAGDAYNAYLDGKTTTPASAQAGQE